MELTPADATTVLSNGVLAALALGLAARLHRAGAALDGRARRLWAAAFAAGGVAALAGCVVHGFGRFLPPWGRDACWKTVLVGTGVAGFLLLAGAALATLEGTGRRVFLVAITGQVALYLILILVSGTNDVRIAAANGALTIVVLLALAAAAPAPERLGCILLALALSAAGLTAQQERLAVGFLNHNDLCHLLQTAALWPFYLAGRRLIDRTVPGPYRVKRDSAVVLS